jgi:hypothetical protein
MKISHFKKRGCPGWGANPGPVDIIYFLIFHHFTAEPQRLPNQPIFLQGVLSQKIFAGPVPTYLF